MLVSLTIQLIGIPEHAWPRLTAACERREPLPTPLGHASAVAGIAVFTTLVGMTIKTGSTVSSVTVSALSAVAAYVGAAALAVFVAPKLITASDTLNHLVPRYAAAVSIPVIASGVLNLIPLTALALLSVMVGIGLSFRSAQLGARDFLGLEGSARMRAASFATAIASVPVVLGTTFRLVL